MLRYFYILVSIQLCFCTEYIDNTKNEYLGRRARSQNGKLPKKHTRNSKKNQLVQFDVDNFMRRPEDDAAEDDGPNHIEKIQENRGEPASYGDYDSFIESNEYPKEKNTAVDYSNIKDDEAWSRVQTRASPDKDPNVRHFNFHSLTLDEKNDLKTAVSHEKPTSTMTTKLLLDRDLLNSDPEKKCSFKNMKMPFFSLNKSTTKAKRQKKRKLFCFNCRHKTTTTQPPDASDKSDDYNKDHVERTDTVESRVSKRAYEQLCPKCIRELLLNLKRKTTKKVKHETKTYHKRRTTAKDKTTVQRVDNLDDDLQDGYYASNVRKKRTELEEQERDRRLKELDEVERKIENVHVTPPIFTRASPYNIEH